MSATLTMEVREKEENVHEKRHVRHVKDKTVLEVSCRRPEGEGGQQSEAARPQ